MEAGGGKRHVHLHTIALEAASSQLALLEFSSAARALNRVRACKIGLEQLINLYERARTPLAQGAMCMTYNPLTRLPHAIDGCMLRRGRAHLREQLANIARRRRQLDTLVDRAKRLLIEGNVSVATKGIALLGSSSEFGWSLQ